MLGAAGLPPAFVLVMPLPFTSGASLRAGTVPGRLRAWADVNPVTRLADAVRGLLTGSGPLAGPVVWSPLWAAGIAVAFVPPVMRACGTRS